MTVNILGAEYTVLVKKYSEDEAFERRSICGYCDDIKKEIVVCDPSTYKGWEHEDARYCELSQKQTLRHEIVHAFLSESGLRYSAVAVDGPWSKNEEMVDWIANQGPKILKAWQDVNAL